MENFTGLNFCSSEESYKNFLKKISFSVNIIIINITIQCSWYIVKVAIPMKYFMGLKLCLDYIFYTDAVAIITFYIYAIFSMLKLLRVYLHS